MVLRSLITFLMMCVDIPRTSGDLESLKNYDRDNVVAAHSPPFVEPHSFHLRLYFAVLKRKPNTLKDMLEIASIWLSRQCLEENKTLESSRCI